MQNHSDTKTKIAAVFNDVASRYDVNRFFSISAQHLVAHADPGGARRMLDVCSGTGIVAIHAAKCHGELSIDAVDISAEMLNQAQAKAKAEGVDNIDFILTDVDDIDSSSTTYDTITCGYGIFFFPDMEKSLKTILATLKPGGKMVFSTFTEQAFSPFTEMFMEDLRRFGAETPDTAVNKLQSREKITGLCDQCGVSGVQIETETIRYKITPDEWWGLINSAAYKGLLNQLQDDQVERLREEHISAVSKHAIDGMIELIADSYYTIISTSKTN